MLFFLTGDIQIGKTRWLTSVLERLVADGVPVAGVLAPGIWIEHETSDGITYEKLGIDNILLPEGERIPFARRRDLAEQDGTYDENSQAGRMQLGWAIDDAAIERVNSHFDMLMAEAGQCTPAHAPGLLVIDELGRLEIERGEGLTSALAMLDWGATQAFPHAVVIVRSGLLDTARVRFADAPWNSIRVINANDAGEAALRGALGV